MLFFSFLLFLLLVRYSPPYPYAAPATAFRGFPSGERATAAAAVCLTRSGAAAARLTAARSSRRPRSARCRRGFRKSNFKPSSSSAFFTIFDFRACECLRQYENAGTILLLFYIGTLYSPVCIRAENVKFGSQLSCGLHVEEFIFSMPISQPKCIIYTWMCTWRFWKFCCRGSVWQPRASAAVVMPAKKNKNTMMISGL